MSHDVICSLIELPKGIDRSFFLLLSNNRPTGTLILNFGFC